MSASRALLEFAQARGLGPDYVSAFERQLSPLLNWIVQCALPRPWILGLSGAQGSGKSTLAAALLTELEARANLRVLSLSLDDFYLQRAERLDLAARKHPLLATRGVPGTHDVKRALDALDGLAGLQGGQELQLPQFDKAADDRTQDRRVSGAFDLIILEGWCLGAPPQAADALIRPCNSLEQEEDALGTWRSFVNGQLSGPYRSLFARIDHQVFLQVPDMDCVYRWRRQQDLETMAGRGHAMSQDELLRFIAHYERITRWMLEVMPGQSDVVIKVDADHHLAGCTLTAGL